MTEVIELIGYFTLRVQYLESFIEAGTLPRFGTTNNAQRRIHGRFETVLAGRRGIAAHIARGGGPGVDPVLAASFN